MQHGVRTVSAQFHVGAVDVRELTQVFRFDVGFCVFHRAGAAFHSNHFTVQIADAFDVVFIVTHHYLQTAFVIAIRKLDRFFTFFGNGDARKGQIDIARLQCRDDAAEVHWLQGIIQLQLFRNGIPQIHIKADIFVTLFEFERNKGGIGSDNQLLICCSGREGEGQRQRGHRNF